VDILITTDNFQTLMDVVIIDPTCINMVQRTSTMTTHAMTLATQKKTHHTPNKHWSMISFPLLLKCMGVFICRFDSFLTNYAQTITARH
jgi:hypothetical protein